MTLLEAAKATIKADAYRTAVLAAAGANEEQYEHANEKFWAAMDALSKAVKEEETK